MIKTFRKSVEHFLCVTVITCSIVGYCSDTLAWGSDGHSAIGIMAISQLQPDALSKLESIVNPLTRQAMIEACNWPDVTRETEEWEWSAPLHYINIPHGDELYTQSRDCPERPDHSDHPQRPRHYCATEGIKHYAAELSSGELTMVQRWQAFAWLCHLVGDLHQPLHAGFASDRGGNDVEVVFKHEPLNLHRFWDSALIHQEAGSWQYLVGELSAFPVVRAGSDWSPEMVNDWTNDSHKLAEGLYPEPGTIDEAYAQQSWEITQQQLILAASRLATIINLEFEGSD